MPIDITSANSKLRIVVPAYYPGGFDVDDYAADNMFETGALKTKKIRFLRMVSTAGSSSTRQSSPST
jgi:hypothetical protein